MTLSTLTTSYTPSELTRRGALGLMAGSIAALAAGQAKALTSGEARALIDRMLGDLNKLINSGRSAQSLQGDFQKFFARYGDVPTIARSTLGPDARRASPAQLRAFSDAFAGYMARKYGKRFREFLGGSLAVTGASQVKSFHEVQTTASLPGQAPFDVTFRVSDRSGQTLFFDMLIAGISLLKTERTEIGAMLDRRRGDLDALIADLKRAG